jgi:hypothetical protein
MSAFATLRAAVVAASVLVSIAASAAENYLCITDMATGFALNKVTKQWSVTTFQSGGKFLLSVPKLDDPMWPKTQ